MTDPGYVIGGFRGCVKVAGTNTNTAFIILWTLEVGAVHVAATLRMGTISCVHLHRRPASAVARTDE